MKSKLLPILLIVLILLNIFLVFMLIKKPHLNRKINSERNFLIEQLHFSEVQTQKFIELDNIHRNNMMNIEMNIRKQKDILFNSFSKESVNVDSLATIAGNLEIKKEIEVFKFFKSVRKICTKEQQIKFDNIIKEAITDGNAKPNRSMENHPPLHNGMPPPPR